MTRRPPTACNYLVSDSFSLPSKGFFSPFTRATSALSVMSLYLALGGGPPSFTPVFSWLALLGNSSGDGSSFAYGAFTFYGPPFQMVRLDARFVTPCRPVRRQNRPTTPAAHRPYGPLGADRFRLIPVRSPLLRESRLLFLPPGT
jgi:hypothetical protein